MASVQDTPRNTTVATDSEKGVENRDYQSSQEDVPSEVLKPALAPNEPPDGGFKAWLCIAGGFCTVFASFGFINCIGVFQDYYTTHQLSTYSSSTIAWIPATESFMLFFFGIVAGKLSDSYGPNKPLLLGSFLHIFGLMMLSISNKYYQIFLSQSVCSGIGCSFLFYPSVAAAGTWFKKHRALAFGIMVSGSSLGGVILPIMVQRLVPRYGFGWAIRITAFFLLGLLVFGNFAVRSRLEPIKKPLVVKEYLVPFKEAPFLLLAIGSLFIYFGGFEPFTFIIVQARQADMSQDLANYLVPIINASSTFGRILPAQLGDMYGVFNVMIIFSLFSGVISLALWIPATSNGPIIAFAILYGFASGLVLSIIPAMVASISDVRKLGFRVGSLYSFSAFGVLFGPPISGAIVNAQHGGYTGLKVFCGAMLLAGTAFVAFARVKLTGFKLLAKK